MASLDAELPGDDGGTAVLADALPDLNVLQPEEQALLKLDLDRALAQLTPRLREVLVVRFLTGESTRKSAVVTDAPNRPSTAGCARGCGK